MKIRPSFLGSVGFLVYLTDSYVKLESSSMSIGYALKGRGQMVFRGIAIFCLMVVFSGCFPPSEKKSMRDLKARLEIVDSLQLDVITSSLNLMDIHDSSGHLLFIETEPPVFYVVSQKGNVILRKTLPVDGPESVGNSILSAEFFKDGVALMGRKTINIYDKNFDFKQSLKIPSFPIGMVYLGFNHLQEAEINGAKYLTVFNGARTDFSADQPEYYQQFNVMDYVNPNVGEFKPVGKLQPGSRYLDNKVHKFLKPAFHTTGPLIHYALDTDTVLYTIDLNTEAVVSAVKIPFDDFVLSSGLTMGREGADVQSQPQDWPGRITNLFYVNDLHVVLYNPGIKLSKIEALNGVYEGRALRDKYDSLNSKRYLILKDGKRLNNDTNLSARLFDVVQVSPDGYLWASQHVEWFEHEPDQVTFYKLKLLMD